MGLWTCIHGVLTVNPFGCTVAEQEYVLKTVLEHQPMIWQDGGLMDVHVNRRSIGNCYSTCDRFGNRTDLLYTCSGGCFERSTDFFITLDARIDDVLSCSEFMHWLCRLAKRVLVKDVLVRLQNDLGMNVTLDHLRLTTDVFEEMYDSGAWVRDHLFADR